MSEAFGLSSHYSFSPGMNANYIDHLVVHPHTSWQGTRGVRVSFGAETQDEMDRLGAEIDASLGEDFGFFYGSDEDFEDFGDEDFGDEDFGDDDEDFDDDDFGRLYLGQEDWRMAPAGPGDKGALLGRSGGSGYRGGRPTFGADAKIRVPGVFEYEGSQAGAVALGFAALVLIFKNPPWG